MNEAALALLKQIENMLVELPTQLCKLLERSDDMQERIVCNRTKVRHRIKALHNLFELYLEGAQLKKGQTTKDDDDHI